MSAILVVDDVETNREFLAALLRASGHSVRTAANGADALDLARAQPPDLVVTDLLMPVVDGYELARAMRQDRVLAQVPVIFQSAHYLEPETESIADACAVAAVVTKADDPERLLDVITQVLLDKRRRQTSTPPDEAIEIEHRRVLGSKLLLTVRELEAADRQRSELLSRVIRAGETERSRIAADIHDDTVQVLTAALLRVELLKRRLDTPEQLGAATNLEEVLQEALARLRSLVFDLRPQELDSAGVAVALRSYLEQLADEWSIVWDVDERRTAALTPDQRTVLFRIAQEALANVRKHADASHVRIRLDGRPDGVLMSVADDGAGFDVEARGSRRGHIGIAGMRERSEMVGGWCHVTSSPGAGTTVEVWFPVDEPASGAERAAVQQGAAP